jgi:uncharacterized protein (TIGR02246 family)
MNTQQEMTKDVTALRALLEDWARAVRAKDVDRILAHYAPEILTYECHTHMEIRGVPAHRAHLEACFPHMEGPMVFEIHDLAIDAEGDLAFGRYLARCGATGADGEEHAGWLRVTVCFRKAAGRWAVVHAHVSAPFDPESGLTMFGTPAGTPELAGTV